MSKRTWTAVMAAEDLPERSNQPVERSGRSAPGPSMNGQSGRIVIPGASTRQAAVRWHEECYVTRKELATIMGISVRTVDRWVAAGMPSYTWGLRARRFLASKAIAWAEARERIAR